MQSIQIETVNPLVASETLAGKAMTFVFVCPVSGHQAVATQTIATSPKAGGDLASKVKQSALKSLRGPLSSAIRGAFGRGTLGKTLGTIASKSAATALTESAKGPAVDPAARDAAALEAFRTVADQFEWDAGRGGWVSSAAAAERQNGFQRLLASAPVAAAYDQEVSARMLVEVARADGDLQAEESDLLQEFLDPQRHRVAELLDRPDLSSAELAEVSAGPVRRSLLTLAWLVALANDGCDAHEEQRLAQFHEALDVPLDESPTPRHLAEEYLLEATLSQALATGDPTTARTALRTLADTLGTDAARVESIEARFHKRRALTATAG